MATCTTVNDTNQCSQWIREYKVYIFIFLAVIIGVIVFLFRISKCRQWMNKHRIKTAIGLTSLSAALSFVFF